MDLLLQYRKQTNIAIDKSHILWEYPKFGFFEFRIHEIGFDKSHQFNQGRIDGQTRTIGNFWKKF